MSDVVFYALAVVVMYLSFRVVKWNHRQRSARHAPERHAEAALRGWTYEQDQTLVFEIERWKGSTDGTTWVGETARTGTRRARIDGSALKGSATLITRWYTLQRMPVAGAVLLMRSASGETDEITKALGEITSPLAHKLVGAVLDVGLPVRFGAALGDEVDGSALKPATLPGSGYEGYSLMATDPSEASALLFQRLGAALPAARAAAGPASLSVLITPKGLSVSVPQRTGRADELEPIVKAGMALAAAMR